MTYDLTFNVSFTFTRFTLLNQLKVMNYSTAYALLVPPIAKLYLGQTLNPDSIKEGDDAYFECSIESNPDTTKLIWKHGVNYNNRDSFF